MKYKPESPEHQVVPAQFGRRRRRRFDSPEDIARFLLPFALSPYYYPPYYYQPYYPQYPPYYAPYNPYYGYGYGYGYRPVYGENPYEDEVADEQD